MIFRVDYIYGWGKERRYYIVTSLMRLFYLLHGTYDFDYIVEIKRISRLPKGVEPISI